MTSQVKYFPIREISTYMGAGWTIKARVTVKGQKRSFNSDRGPGQVFSVDLLDKDGGEIRASMFNKAVDKFFPQIETGNVYTFAKAQVKVANKRFNNSGHSYELVFNEDAVITLVESQGSGGSAEAVSEIEQVKFRFVPIRDLLHKQIPCTVDIIGLIKEVRPVSQIVSKNTGESMSRRVILVADKSECSVEITLWRDQATQFEGNPGGLFAAKACSIREYQGSRYLTLTQASVSIQDPKHSSVAALAADLMGNNVQSMGTFNISAVGGSQQLGDSQPLSQSQSGSKFSSLTEVREASERHIPDKGLFFEFVGRLTNITTRGRDQADVPIYYEACPTCNKKVTKESDMMCAQCQKQVTPKLRYMFRAQFSDHNDDCYATVFDQQAQIILADLSADKLNEVKLAQNLQTGDILKNFFLTQLFSIRLKVTANEYRGESRPRMTVLSVEPVNFVSHSTSLLQKLSLSLGSSENGGANGLSSGDTRDAKMRRVDTDKLQTFESPGGGVREWV